MKKLLYIIPLTILIACGGGTNDGSSENETSAEENTTSETAGVSKDLTEYGFSYSIVLPDKKNVETVIMENNMGGVDIQQGENFWITINYGEGDLDLLKFDLEEHEFFVAEIIEESPNHMMYKLTDKAGNLKESHHFFYVVSADGDVIEIQNSKDADFSAEAVQSMLQAAKSFQAKAGA